MELLRTTQVPEALRLDGELDMAAANRLAQALSEAIDAGIRTVDLSGVTFIDSSGLRVLMDAADSLDGQGYLVLLRPSRTVSRLLGIALPGATPGIVIRTD